MESNMKQDNVRRLLRFCVPAALLLLSAGIGFGQAKSSGSSSSALQAVDPDSFLLADLEEAILYPETDYGRNPAILGLLSWDPLIVDLDAALTRDVSTSTRLDESEGALGGTDETLDQTLDGDMYLEKVFHFGKNNSDALAWSLSGDFTWDTTQEHLTNYDAYTENVLYTTEDLPFTVGTNLVWGSKSGLIPFPVGARLGYSFSLDKALFTWVQDSLLSAPYVSDTKQDYDQITHALKASLGAVLPISKVAEFAAAVRYEGSLMDKDSKYIAMDEDQDGYDESIETTTVYYQTYEENGGPAVTATSYSYMDLTVDNNVYVDPTMRLFITDNAELFFTGSWKAFGLSWNETYERIRLTTDVSDDLSDAVYTYDSGLTSFEVLAGLSFKDAGGQLKLGIGYAQDDVRFHQEGTDSSGDSSLYSSLNTNNYTEMNLGTDPANETITASDDVISPTTDVTRSVFATVGWTYKPIKGVGLYLSAKLSGSLNEKVYNAYNLDTRTVWTETVTSSSIDWAIKPAAGFYMPLGPKATLVLDLSGSDNTGTVTSDSETAPTSSYTTTDGSIDLSGGSAVSLTASVRLLFRF